jgi:hypothetical protein
MGRWDTIRQDDPYATARQLEQQVINIKGNIEAVEIRRGR